MERCTPLEPEFERKYTNYSTTRLEWVTFQKATHLITFFWTLVLHDICIFWPINIRTNACRPSRASCFDLMFNLEQTSKKTCCFKRTEEIAQTSWSIYAHGYLSFFSPTWLQGRSQRNGLSNQEFIMTELIREYLVFKQCTSTVSVLTTGTLLCHFVYHRRLVSICEGVDLRRGLV